MVTLTQRLLPHLRPRPLTPIRVARPPRTTRPAPLSDAPLAPWDDRPGSWPGHLVDLDGVRVHVRSTPAGPDAEPALFVHGLGGSATNWTALAGLLSDRLAVDAVDLPGFGRSDPPRDDDYSLEGQAATLEALIERSGRGPVHLVGNSMGGAISILVAARRPDLVRTLTLISPAVPDNALRVHPLRHDWRMGLLILPWVGTGAMRRLAAVPVEQRVRATIAMCFADPDRLGPARLAEAVDEARARVTMPWAEGAMLRSTRALVRAQFARNRAGWSTLRRVRVPSLVLWGDRDKLVAPDLAPYVAAALPDARVRVFADIGHTAMLEDPESTARAILALLDEVADREA